MPRARRLARSAAFFGAFSAFALANASSALAESCVYDAVAKTVTASISPGEQATLKVSAGSLTFGSIPVACGAATTTNTDSISIAGNAGTNETLILDQQGGVFGPGVTVETNIPEIEIATTLGDATDTVKVYGTNGDDTMAPGQLGLALFTDGDVDVTFSPSAFRMEIYGLDGADYVNGFGQGGAGMHFLGPLVVDGGNGDDVLLRGSTENDQVIGGAGNDVLEGNNGADVVDGGPGNDSISAGGGDDDITGGAGSDSISASDGNDTIHADDAEADTSINGGPGTDTAYLDSGLDPTAVAVENKIFGPPPPPPPPPPAGSCVYDAAAKTATASMAAGSQATLKVVGAEIWFGTTPAACGAATTGNTDSISVSGLAGSTEQLTIDQSGGAFAPGATAETGTGAVSEIELAVSLGDAADGLVVLGTPADDLLSIGLNGIALNADSDVDVTLSPAPAVVELRGLGGINTLGGQGGNGAGGAFLGRVLLYAGDLGDTLRGAAQNDELYGGAGADTLEGRAGNDTITGAGGNDTLAGSSGNDDLTGGPGTDSLSGSDGDDTLRADDDANDPTINGGPGVDTAYYDAGIDPVPVAVENKIPA